MAYDNIISRADVGGNAPQPPQPGSAPEPANATPDAQPDQPAPGEDVGQAEVQEKMDAAEDKGYFGEKVDPRPNEDYTVRGVGQAQKDAQAGK